jgi:hypothetical protein
VANEGAESGAERRKVMAVIGAGADLAPGVYAAAQELGCLAVDAGFRVATGGLGGVMEAVSRGAHESARWSEGAVVGVLPGYDAGAANAWVDVVIASGLGIARNVVLVASADVVVAVGGCAGTLSELAVAWQLGKPIVALAGHGWSERLGGERIDDRRADRIARAESPAEAVALALGMVRRG